MYNVIIVEDDAIVRMYLKSLIEWQKHSFNIVAQLENGLEAKKFIEKNNVDIVLTDVSMPVMNGIELIKYIKDTGKLIKSIILSCYSDYDFIRDALKCGVCDYILKQNLTKESLLSLLIKVAESLNKERENINKQNETNDIVKSNILNKDILTLEDEKNLLNFIIEGNLNLTAGFISGYIDKIQISFSHINNIKICIMDLLNIIARIAVKCDIDFMKLFGVNYIPYEEIEVNQNIEDIKLWLTSIIKKIIELNNEENNCHRLDILRSIEYIENHYTEDISLKDISNYVSISPNYFSMIFKKEIGVSFSEYLLNKRLENSKLLLKKNNAKVYEIAFKVGFNNNQYFNRVFKDKFGITPLEYKKKFSNE